jgi:NitT/TauT family transport system substrate-binding protein
MRRILTTVFILLLAVFPLAAAGVQEEASQGAQEQQEQQKEPAAQAQSGDAEPLTVRAAVFKGPSGFGMIRLFEEKPELGENVKTELSVLPTPQEMVARVAGGELDFAVFPSNMAAKLYTKGPGYKLGAVTGMGLLSVVSSDSSIKEWADLKGRTVKSIGKGATPDYLFRYLLKENGLEPGTDVTLDFSVKAAPQLAQLVIGGKAETAVLPEPFVTMVRLKSENAGPVLSFQESWKKVQGTEQSYPITVVVVKPQFAEQHPEVVGRFLSAYRDSIQWVNANPSDAAQLIGEYGVLPSNLAEPAIPHTNLRFIPAQEARPLMESYLEVLLDFNPAAVGGKLPDDQFYLEW